MPRVRREAARATAIQDPDAIRAILDCLGLSSRPPPPPQPDPLRALLDPPTANRTPCAGRGVRARRPTATRPPLHL